MNDQPENASPQPDPKRETKELTPPLPALLKDQPNEPPPIPQGDDAMPNGNEPFTPEQKTAIRTIVREEIESSIQFKEVQSAARRIETNADQMQRTFAADQMQRAAWEREYKEHYGHLKREIEANRDKTAERFDRMEARMNEDEEERRKWRQLIESVREEIQNVRSDVRDGHYRIGDAFVPVVGRNPFLPDSTPVMIPLRQRVESTETHIQNTDSNLEKMDARLKFIEQAEMTRIEQRRRQQEWLNKAVPVFVQKVAFNPLVIRGLLALASVLAAALGIDILN